MQAGGAVQDRFYIFTAPLPPANAAANFFTLDRLALQPLLRPGAEKRGRQKEVLQQQQLLFL